MTTKVHIIAQVLATLLQVLNMVSGMVPPKYQPWVMFAIAVVQAGMGLYNHYYNPDGTPSSVAYIAKVLLLCFLLGGVAMAQTQPSQPVNPPTPLFSVSQQAMGVHIGGQIVAASDSIGSFNLTPNLQLQSDNILAPENGLQAYLGGIKYYASFLSKPLAKTSLSDIKPYIHGAVGVVRNVPATGPSTQHYSALAGAGFDYQVNGVLSVGPRMEYFNAPGFGKSPHGAAVSANLTLVLGNKK